MLGSALISEKHCHVTLAGAGKDLALSHTAARLVSALMTHLRSILTLSCMPSIATTRQPCAANIMV